MLDVGCDFIFIYYKQADVKLLTESKKDVFDINLMLKIEYRVMCLMCPVGV